MQVNIAGRARLGVFDLDLRAGELSKDGRRVLLQEQPWQVLRMLLAQPGKVVTREEIREKLWPNDTVVDFDQGINTAIRKLREAFGDSAENPKYIETVARRGYRFMMQVEWAGATLTPGPASAEDTSSQGSGPQESKFGTRVLTGIKVSHYRVLEILGGGGMGVVYKAEDIKLGRRVAMKFLPEELASDPVSLERFEREARAASALDHPNICPIYEFGEHEGQPFIVMPLLEGQTLRERIGALTPVPSPTGRGEKESGFPSPQGRGWSRPAGADEGALGSALQIDELVNIAIQIAHGLVAAHQRRITHRDIKPANIFITTRGEAKILDFGLAKLEHQMLRGVYREPLRAAQRDSTGSESAQHDNTGDVTLTASGGSASPEGPSTRSQAPDPHLTRTGLALGTAGYMSPEQVRGKKLDARTDLFSFGLVLYEMATGQQAFRGNTAPILREDILKHTPTPVRELNPGIPPKLAEIINHALEKDREARYQGASEMRAELESLRRAREPRRSGARLWASAAIICTLLVAVGIFWFANPRPPSAPELRQRQLTTNSSENPVQSSAISSDGKYLAYADLKGIHIKLIATGETRTLPQTEALEGSQMEWRLAWFPDGTRLLAGANVIGRLLTNLTGMSDSIWTVSVTGGAPRKIRDGSGQWTALSPDGTAIAFCAKAGIFAGGREIWLAGPDGEQARKLFATDEHSDFRQPFWSPDGQRVAYLKKHQAPDKVEEIVESRDLKGGPPIALLDGKASKDFCWLPDGRLIYVLAEPETNRDSCNYWEMRIHTRTGQPDGKPRRLTNWIGFCMESTTASADGKRLTFKKLWTERGVDVADLETSRTRITNLHRLTLSESDDLPIGWTPDSKAVIFASNRNGEYRTFKQSLSEDSAEQMFTGPVVARVSPDGAWLLYKAATTKAAEEAGLSSPAVQVMRVPIAGGAPQLVMTAPIYNAFRCARSPATLCVFTEWREHKQLIFTAFDPVKGRGRELARFDTDPKAENYSWDLSPDGTRIAVMKWEDPKIYILFLSGQARQEIAVEGSQIGTEHLGEGFDWAADGKGLFLSGTRPGESLLLYVDLHGSVHVLREERGDFVIWAVPSPDGHRLGMPGHAFHSNVWMMENF